MKSLAASTAALVTALAALSGLAQASSLDQLLILSSDGQSYTSQFTIEAGSRTLEVALPGSVVPDVIKTLGTPNHKNTVDPVEPGEANDPANSSTTSKPSNPTDPDPQSGLILLDNSVLLLRYEHQYNAEISISPGQSSSSSTTQQKKPEQLDRVFTLSGPAVSLVKNPEDLDAVSIIWIFPAEFTVNSWQSDDSQARWSMNNNQLQFNSEAATPANISITYTQPANRRIDLDVDGIPDDIDDCLSTPPNVLVNSTGCALDFDKDGVANSFDQCPDSATGTQVDDNGCEPDGDSDGVADALDRCSATPAIAEIDAEGCAIDTDADSVPDYRDTCPVQQFVKRIEGVDWWGCQIVGPLRLTEIYFKTGSSNLDNKARDILDKIALAMNFHATSRFEIAAHTDWLGTPENNQALSLRRATVVRQYLLLKGIQPRRLLANGYGESRAIASNETLYGRQRNRRIEIIKIPD